MKSKSILIAMLLAFTALPLVFANGDSEEKQDSDGTTVIKLARFFGDTSDALKDETDVSKAKTEGEVIQILTNLFNAENDKGIVVERLGGGEWGSYYDALNVALSAGDPPDVAVMHGSNMPDYTSRRLLLPLDNLYSDVSIQPNDWTAPAAGAVSYEGSKFGVPFDLHANLFHVNVDIFKEAGLVDSDGVPILPQSREEFFEQAEIIKQKTGKYYMVTDAVQYPIGVRILFSLVWQQGSDLVSSDGKSATVDTPEAAEAIDFMLELFEKGYSEPSFDYTAAQDAFLNGEAAILHNGTWAVDQYNREAKFMYRAMDFPTLYKRPAVWANSHMWVIPKQESDENYWAALEFLAFLNEHIYDWSAGTGHLATRKSALQDFANADVPQRANYSNTAGIAKLVPSIVNWQAVEDILKEEIEKTWLLDADPDSVLEDADERINTQLNR